MARPIVTGLLVALAVSAAWAFLSAALGFHFGLLVVGAFGGWLIGATVRPLGSRAGAVATALGLVSWVVATVLDFALSQALLQAAATPLADRLNVGNYLSFVTATFDVVQLISIALLLLVAWRSAR